MRRLTAFCSIPSFALLLLVVTGGLPALGSTCPTPPDRPQVSESKQPRVLEPYSITQTVAHYYEASLGLGFLEVVEVANQHYYDWMYELELPLWQTPDATGALGWLFRGRILAETDVEALTGVGMVETDYEHTSFIVWEIREDWVKLKLADDLFAWTHRCHLGNDEFTLEFVRWQTFFRRHADWLHFRVPVAHVLRASPSIESEPVTMIGLDHKLVLLDIRDDWMRVEAHQPDLTCTGPDPDQVQATEHVGWVKWRAEQGPWVYIYTRGC